MRHSRPPTIRRLVGWIVILPVVVASAALVTLSTVTTRRVAESIGASYVDSATAGVTADVRNYLSSAQRISELYTRRVLSGSLSDRDLLSWQRPMLDDLVTNPDVASICFGNPEGDATWLSRVHNRMELGRAEGANANRAVEYVITESGEVSADPIRVYQYDPRKRPWYDAALKSEGPVWTPIYFWFQDQGADSVTGSGCTRAVRDAQGNLLGVLVIDVTLRALSDYLRRTPIAESGYVFIIDEDGLLVAASEGHVNSTAGERLKLASSESPAGREAARVIAAARGGRGRNLALLKLEIDGRRMRLDTAPLEPYAGIRWQIVTIIPESLFLEDAYAMQRRSIHLAAIASIGALVIGLMLSRKLSTPILKLTDHVKGIGGGDFDSRLDLRAARELEVLSVELNKMSAGLRQRMELEQSLKLATQVQQNLLPQKAPTLAGLDVSGFSRYCDATGGDYFDFVDVSRISDRQTLIAVGDVTGHGIGAALLMATARAAVRSSVLTGASLGEVMTRVNTTISRDSNHGLYMTMTLMAVDPAGRTVRWACAGHDPIIHYDPRTRSLREFDDGFIPLGTMDEVAYEEYTADGIVAGSILIVGTDGIWEARNPAGNMYGKERMRKVILANTQASAKELGDAIRQDLEEFLSGRAIQDDVTLVVVRVTGGVVFAD